MLSVDIRVEVERLNGRFVPVNFFAPPMLGGKVVPEPMKQFLYDVQWPPQQEYESDEESDLWVWLVELGVVGWLDMEELGLEGVNGRCFVTFGLTDGGNYLLLLDLDDPNPTDPQVYKIDHDDPEQIVRPRLPLSRFLGLLKWSAQK